MRKPDDAPAPLAKVIDFEQARARRLEVRATRKASEPAEGAQEVEPGSASSPAAVAPGAVELRRQRDHAVLKRRRLQERTAQKRAAAAKHRIQLRVSDRLARVEAELAAEIARLRLLYAERRQRGGGVWMWPTVAMSLLAIVAGFAYFAGAQRTYAASAVRARGPLVARQLTVRAPSPETRVKGRQGAAPGSRSEPPSAGSPAGPSHEPVAHSSGSALRPAFGPGCGGTPYRSMSPASGSTGGTP